MLGDRHVRVGTGEIVSPTVVYGRLEADMHDIVIKNGTLVDGTGAEPVVGDVAVKGGRIAEVGGSITPHHLTCDRTDLLANGMRPHLYCKPVINSADERRAIAAGPSLPSAPLCDDALEAVRHDVCFLKLERVALILKAAQTSRWTHTRLGCD